VRRFYSTIIFRLNAHSREANAHFYYYVIIENGQGLGVT